MILDVHKQLVFPELNYPTSYNYKGKTKCSNPLSDDEFKSIALTINSELSDFNRMVTINDMLPNICLETSQIMKISSLFTTESNRLSFVKEAFNKCYDIDNYGAVIQMFSQKTYIDDIHNFVQTNSYNDYLMPTVDCEVTETEMFNIMSSLRESRFENSRITLSKHIIKTNQCFTTGQILKILELFNFEDSKLLVAKFAYDYTLDNNDYYKIVKAFSFKSKKEELNRFIETKRRN